jgi:uncharacterized lipoprotein
MKKSLMLTGIAMVAVLTGCATSERTMRSNDDQTVYVKAAPGYQADQLQPNEIKVNEAAGAQRKDAGDK